MCVVEEFIEKKKIIHISWTLPFDHYLTFYYTVRQYFSHSEIIQQTTFNNIFLFNEPSTNFCVNEAFVVGHKDL